MASLSSWPAREEDEGPWAVLAICHCLTVMGDMETMPLHLPPESPGGTTRRPQLGGGGTDLQKDRISAGALWANLMGYPKIYKMFYDSDPNAKKMKFVIESV